ncbi:MAG: hypothetical protein AAFQ89_10575 [Cyanobacteria bacterium J06626_18]
MFFPSQQPLPTHDQPRSRIELVALCGLAIVSATMGIAGTLAYVTLSWSHYNTPEKPLLEESPSVEVFSNKAPSRTSAVVESGLAPVENTLQLQPQVDSSDTGQAVTSLAKNYATDVLPLVTKHGVDEVWFAQLCDRWATFSGQTWASLSETAKAELANDLLFRLKEGLHPETLAHLGHRNTLYYQSLTRQREAAGQSKEAAHDKADDRFFVAFPELKTHRSAIANTGFDDVWFAFLEDVILQQRPTSVYREEVAIKRAH